MNVLSGSMKKNAHTPSTIQSLAATTRDPKTILPAYYMYKVIRKGEIVLEETTTSIDLKRFKDSVNQVDAGNECGLSIDSFRNIQEGDEVECYEVQYQTKILNFLASTSSNKTSGAQEENSTSGSGDMQHGHSHHKTFYTGSTKQ